MKDKVFIIFILGLIAIILIQYFTRPTPTNYEEYIKIGGKEYIKLSQNIDTLWLPQDTIKVPEYIPQIADVVIVEVPIDTDTTAILQGYFAKYFFSDIVPLDSIGTIQINDTISRNRIISRSILFNYKIPIIKDITIVKEKPINQMYIGGGINFDKIDFINSVYGSFLFKTKKDRIFAINFGGSYANLEVKPYIGGALYWKINLKKKIK